MRKEKKKGNGVKEERRWGCLLQSDFFFFWTMCNHLAKPEIAALVLSALSFCGPYLSSLFKTRTHANVKTVTQKPYKFVYT